MIRKSYAAKYTLTAKVLISIHIAYNCETNDKLYYIFIYKNEISA